MAQESTKPSPEHQEGLQQSLDELAAAFGAKQSDFETPPVSEPQSAGANLDMIMRIPVTVQIVLGTATMPVASLVKLGRGAVVPLDRRVGEPVDVVVNGRVVARGEVVVVDEDSSRFGISLTEVISNGGL